ncbi:hypothetical protein [Vreelandella alkaliphila]|uniref:hypothetical protein n=1 Tax=Vreelandella alkaliphila TaxID=272774 RepID=UPI003FD798F0
MAWALRAGAWHSGDFVTLWVMQWRLDRHPANGVWGEAPCSEAVTTRQDKRGGLLANRPPLSHNHHRAFHC